MSHIEEAQFDRTCILVLRICPSTLRKVIDDHCTRNGRISLEELLEKNKHALFHRLQKRCCCKYRYSGTAPGPVNKFSWELLYIKNSSSCLTLRNRRDECPCQYDAKIGITTGDMDVTLCCHVIHNMCPGVNMSHIATICDIRNKVIHGSSTRLDNKTYKEYWDKVKTAIIDIANRVSREEYTRTLDNIAELRNRVLNSHELGELRKLIVDQKRIESLEENQSEILSKVCQMTKDHDKMAEDGNQRMAQIEGKVDNMTQNMPNLEGSMEKMTQTLTQIKGEIDQTTQTVTKLEGSMETTTQNMTKLEGRMDMATQAVTQLEGRMGQLTQNMTKVEESVETTTKKTTQLEGIMNQMTQTVTQIEGNLDQTTQTVTKLEGIIETTTQNMTKLDGRMDQMAQTVTKIEGSVQQLTVKVTMLAENYQRTQNTDAQIEKVVDMTSHIEYNVNKSKETDTEGRDDQVPQKLIQIEQQKQCVIQRAEIGKNFEMQRESQTSQNVSQRHRILAKIRARKRKLFGKHDEELDIRQLKKDVLTSMTLRLWKSGYHLYRQEEMTKCL